MFGFSILYLFLLFAVLLVDRLWGVALRQPLRGMTIVSECHERGTKPETGIRLTEQQLRARRRARSRSRWRSACFVLVFYLVTLVKLGPNVLTRPM